MSFMIKLYFEMKIYVGVEKIEYEMSHLEIDGPVAMPGK